MRYSFLLENEWTTWTMNAHGKNRLLENLQGPYLESNTELPVLWCTASTNCATARHPPPFPPNFRVGFNKEKIIFVDDVVNNTYVLYYTLIIIMSIVVVNIVNIGAVKFIGN